MGGQPKLWDGHSPPTPP